jgi:hypothetical protein
MDNILSLSSNFNISRQNLENIEQGIATISKKYSSLLPSNIEIELRFNKSITQSQFSHIFDSLKTISKYETEYTIMNVFDNEKNYEGKLRTISFFSSEAFDNQFKKIYQIKKRLSVYDAEIEPYFLRLSESSEQEIKDVDVKTSPTYSKYQTRYIFKFVSFEVHLSKIKEGDKNIFNMEIEIKDTSNIMNIIKFGFILLTNSLSLVDTQTKNKIVDIQKDVISRNSSVKNQMPSPSEKFYPLFDNKPVSLDYNNINNIQSNYVVTNKLDGVHYNLVLFYNTAYFINATDIIFIANYSGNYKYFWDDVIKSYDVTVFDGELVFDPVSFKFVFNIFDSIIIKGKNVAMTKPFLERIGKEADTIINAFNSFNVNKLLHISIKKTFYSNNIYNDIDNCLKYIKTTYGSSYKDKNDGLIFVHSKNNYNDNIYKWKFPSRITIDGKIKLVNKDKFTNIYKFELYDRRNNVYIPLYLDYNRTKEIYLVTDKNIVLNDGEIVEAFYDNTKRQFKFERVRYDKAFPNAILTGINTLKQAKNPIDENDLITYFSKLRSQQPTIRQEQDKKSIQEYSKVSVPVSKKITFVRESKYEDKLQEEIKLLTNEKQSIILEEEKLEKRRIEKKNKQNKQREEIERENSLESIEINKVRKINLLFTDKNIVRVGVIGEGSCLIHSILFSLDTEYRTMETSKRYLYAKFIRQKMMDLFTPSIWSFLGKEQIAFSSVQEALNKYIETNEPDKMKEFDEYNVKFEIPSENVLKSYVEYMSKQYPVVSKIVGQEFKKIKSLIGSCAFFDIYTIEYASLFFKCNLLIIKDINRYVESSSLNLYKPENPSIFVLNIDGKHNRQPPHFEAMGLLNKNELTAIFKDDDELVREVFVYHDNIIEERNREISEEKKEKDMMMRKIRDIENRITMLVDKRLEVQKEEERELMEEERELMEEEREEEKEVSEEIPEIKEEEEFEEDELSDIVLEHSLRLFNKYFLHDKSIVPSIKLI